MYLSYFFAVGVFAVAYWPTLPGAVVAGGLFFAGLLLTRVRSARPLAWLLLGLCYGICWGNLSMARQLPDHLTPSDHQVVGVIEGIPVANERRQRFNLKVLHSNSPLQPRRLRLNWYDKTVELMPGQVWQLKVRLRRPRGSVNPGGFDYQAWLIRQGIGATGYVRSAGDNRMLKRLSTVDYWRYTLRQHLLEGPLSQRAASIMAALTVGDRSLIGRDTWDRMSRFGLVHLLVVSGLHIGFVATIGYGIGVLVMRFLALSGLPLNARYGGAATALLFAAGYSVLAGFSLPTQRALVMIAAAIVSLLANRHVAKSTGFGLALAGVALLDPLAAVGAGFWLSFGAVAGLLWLTPNRVAQPRWRSFFQVQWIVFLILCLPLLLWQLPIAWLSPVLNLVAIPWVGFLVVPISLLGMVAAPLAPGLAASLWVPAGWQLDLLLTALDNMVLPDWLPHYPSWPLTGIGLGLTVAAVGLLLLPRGFPGRWLSILLLVALLAMPKQASHPLSVTVLDVGQGLSVVVQTARHLMVYDAGPGYGEGFDSGTAIVAPYLRRIGATHLDKLVVSHDDNDHAGGVVGLTAHFPTTDIRAGESASRYGASAEPCIAGYAWRWDGVDFQFLHPPGESRAEGNNRSCVLLVSYGEERILLTGDIESAVERRLVNGHEELKGPLSLLLAPHHGSKTSSSAYFVSTLRPQHVVFSAGYRHHYGHPADEVVERYRSVGATVWRTAEQGAIGFHWNASGALVATAARTQWPRYWF